MSGNGLSERKRAQQLMMAALDGEISGEERRELDRYLEEDAGLRDEWNSMSKVKEVTASMAFREPPEEIWAEYWTSVYNRFERGVGWILVSVGAVVVLAYAAWEAVQAMFRDADVPLFFKLAILAMAVGLLVLVFSVIREKLFTRRKDPYKEIER